MDPLELMFWAVALGAPLGFLGVMGALVWEVCRHCDRTVAWCKNMEGYDR